ncbi:MAG: hypothetical protein CL946_01800 [Ectothiorhodospiraceae bacterium]|nr:hypothetical protein [Ectothiorhodospiraceae bacterium]
MDFVKPYNANSFQFHCFASSWQVRQTFSVHSNTDIAAAQILNLLLTRILTFQRFVRDGIPMRKSLLIAPFLFLIVVSPTAISQVENAEAVSDTSEAATDSTLTAETSEGATEVLESEVEQDATTEEQESRTLSGIEFDGFVVDRTISKIGRDFYDLFYSQWEAPKGAKGYSLIISEKVMPRFGTQIIIEIDDQKIFEQFVQPRYDIIEQMAQYGVYYAYMHLVQTEQLKDDLEDQDMQGTGIY